jgi:hypothetical protein
MPRLDLHLTTTLKVLMVLLGFASCGFTPLVMWLVSVRHYPSAFDAEGLTQRSGQKLPWKSVTGVKKLVVRHGSTKSVVGVSLSFGNTRVKIAPRVLAEGNQVLPYLSRVLGQDLTRP